MKKKIFIPILAVLIYFIICGFAPKLAGAIALIGGIGGAYYLYAKNENFKSKNKFIKILTGIALTCFVLIFAVGGLSYDPNRVKENKTATNAEQSKNETQPDDKEKDKEVTSNSTTGELKIHFINVGQADAILVQQGSENMMIDAGNNEDEGTLKSYLTSQGIQEFKYVIGTHAHEDHIGSMDYIVNSFKVGKIYFPKQTATTKVFENFVGAVKDKGMQLSVPKVGDTFDLGDAKCTVLAPNGSNYEDGNDYSIVIRVDFGSTSFLLTGDAEAVSEMEMVKAGANMKVDLLKVGHHGSRSSTCANFLSGVSPKYAVISVGKGNSYGHPAQSTMDRLKEKGIQVFRTDENGTIVVTSNGKEITFNTSPGSYTGIASNDSNTSSKNNSSVSSSKPEAKPQPTPQPSENKQVMVWLSATGDCYHRINNCGKMNPNKARQVTLEEAKKQYKPCSKCNPPQ